MTYLALDHQQLTSEYLVWCYECFTNLPHYHLHVTQCSYPKVHQLNGLFASICNQYHQREKAIIQFLLIHDQISKGIVILSTKQRHPFFLKSYEFHLSQLYSIYHLKLVLQSLDRFRLLNWFEADTLYLNSWLN